MNITAVIIAAVIVGGTGLFIGVFLGLAGKKFAVEVDEREEAIESLENGYDTYCTPEIFSQGQWQLLSIARAAVAEPKLLLLDEITANLDAETEKAVLAALKRVAKDRTVISISHRTSAELGRTIQI